MSVLNFQRSSAVGFTLNLASLSLLPSSVGGGVVDSGYRGNIGVILTNFSASDLNINLGDKIAQIMFIKPAPVFFEEVSDFSDNTVRGSGGFGSTGQWLNFLAEKKW